MKILKKFIITFFILFLIFLLVWGRLIISDPNRFFSDLVSYGVLKSSILIFQMLLGITLIGLPFILSQFIGWGRGLTLGSILVLIIFKLLSFFSRSSTDGAYLIGILLIFEGSLFFIGAIIMFINWIRNKYSAQ